MFLAFYLNLLQRYIIDHDAAIDWFFVILQKHLREVRILNFFNLNFWVFKLTEIYIKI